MNKPDCFDQRRQGVRRRALITSGIGAYSWLIAGCLQKGDPDRETDSTPTETSAGTDPESPDEESTRTPLQSYPVEMSPVGEVTFEAVPESWETYFPGYADMGVALGQAEGLTAVGFKSRYFTGYYDELEGVSGDKDGITQLYNDGIDKELYYELDNDVHITDPEWLVNNSFFGLERSDIEELAQNVAPFIGNTIFRRTDEWHSYRYYTMYEAFEKVAQIFQREEQYSAFKSLHDDFIAEIQADLPPADARPNGLLCFAAEDKPEEFSPYRLTDKGTNKKHFRDLGISDSLSGTGVQGLSTSERGTIDYETILKVDPDALFIRGHESKSRSEFEDTVLKFMQEHSVASELASVQNDAVYRGGPIYQGPIQNLFLTERFATQLYPDSFSGDLFNRSEVSAIINEDI